MKIAEREIGMDNPPYVVAEISGNHCGSLENARRLIKAAKRAGAHAVKTQCYEPDTITIDCNKVDFIAQSGLWKGRTLYELYGKAHTPFKWHRELYSLAKDEGITIFSSVFDRSAVDLLERYDCPAYKIASFEIVDLPLIEYAASTGKPLIISTGLASQSEILDATADLIEVALLHCTSEYPAPVESANLWRMEFIRRLTEGRYPVGISDHTIGSTIPIATTALGAAIIEKHLRLASIEESEDADFSMLPLDFHRMANDVLATWQGLQESKVDTSGRQFRRSLYAVKDIRKGEEYSLDNIRSIRPGFGLPPRMLGELLGRKSTKDYRKGDPLS